MSTRAIKLLKSRGINFEVRKYDHKIKGAEFAAVSIDYPLERTIKTLVVDPGRKNYMLVLMPGHMKLDLKKLAAFLSVKKVAMADTKTAERLTGYLVGGISPFGTKKKLPVVMEASLLNHKKVAINGGQRGTMLLMNPEDIVSLTRCKIFDSRGNQKEK